MFIGVGVLLIAIGLGVVAGGRHRRRRTGTLAAPEPRSEEKNTFGQTPGTDVAILEGADGSQLLIERVDALPEHLEALPSHLAKQLVGETVQAAPHLQRLVAGRGSDLYRVVKMPEGGLVEVADKSGLYRGFGMKGGKINEHAQLRKVRVGAVSPALALTLASAALGAYWQQQMDATLRGIQASLDGIRSRLDLELDARLDLAERVLAEHEAAPPEARYEPPGSVTDGLQANLIERRQLQRLLERLDSYDDSAMRHRDYHSKVLTIDGERLDEHAYRALRGLFVELRVLRLKRLGGLLEPAGYHTQLEQQEEELRAQLDLIEQLLEVSLRLDGSHEEDGRRIELPKAREQRQERELQHTLEARRQLSQLRDATRDLAAAATTPSLDEQPLELLIGSVDGTPQAYLPSASTEPNA